MKAARQRDAGAHRTMLAAREAWVDERMLELRIDARTAEDMERVAARWTRRFRLAYHGLGRIARRARDRITTGERK